MKKQLEDTQNTITTPRITSELQEASKVQNVLLQHTAPPCSSLHCYGHTVPAHYLSGDYYDFVYEDNKQKYWVFAGDVMGKGIPAFTKMAMLRTAVRTLAPHSESPSELLRKVNQTLFEDFKLLRSFTTLFCGMYDIERNTFTYASAGHPQPVLKRMNQPSELLQAKGIAIGFIQDYNFQEETVMLQPNDYIFIFTDGITEAKNEKDEQFGRDRIIDVVNQHNSNTCLIENITNRILTYSNYEQRDDATMVTIKRT
ncbi:hypothetical protein E3U55_15580 [Filobacillus milosensis]|uniref:PPM-type phosphatase domain-containing protein n=1 Tax=Filobacillus milosensis TaxID=94137 RepID=A0A4Y8ICF8_9BACI|nr:PP2C family protein-serine/threonine phosphatase [Filobacillus milosensis]TFB13677.1 hypothetical protein E3U55_15580 [Filobacillus milosensis]